MELTPVDSTAVQALGFQNDRLIVRLKGGLYACDATRQDFEDFLAAESKGRHLGVWRPKLRRVCETCFAEDCECGGTVPAQAHG